MTSGAAAESAAADFLQRHGLQLVAKNYRSRYGEIDLICQDGPTIVFVEVRLRSNPHFGSAGDSITWRKQQKLLRTAKSYLAQHKPTACRFDAILFGAGDIEWIRNAISE